MTLLTPLFVLALYVLVRSADIAISAGVARDTIRAVVYGIVAILALLVVFVTLFGAMR